MGKDGVMEKVVEKEVVKEVVVEGLPESALDEVYAISHSFQVEIEILSHSRV